MLKTKGKPRGRPFISGDPRSYKGGSSSKEKQDFKAQFKMAFDEEVNVRKIVRALLRSAEQGVPWAVQEVLNRGLGKPVQAIEDKFGDGPKIVRILYAGDSIDEETGLVIRRNSANPLDIRAGRPIEEERARIARLQERTAGGALVAFPDPNGGEAPDPDRWPDHLLRGQGRKLLPPTTGELEMEEAEKRRQLEVGKEAETEAEKAQDYIEACEKAG